jgi:hypothetical protein
MCLRIATRTIWRRNQGATRGREMTMIDDILSMRYRVETKAK